MTKLTHSKGNEHKKKLMAYGAKVHQGMITLYRGADASIATVKRLRYGDYLSATAAGQDATGNSGASAYGGNVVEFILPIDDVDVTGAGEYQFKGKSESLVGGIKYPLEIYRAYNDYYASNYSAAEIDAQNNVRSVASMALSGGRDEFDELVEKHLSHNVQDAGVARA